MSSESYVLRSSAGPNNPASSGMGHVLRAEPAPGFNLRSTCELVHQSRPFEAPLLGLCLRQHHISPIRRLQGMLTVEENERLCKVGPGTGMGELMRRYWQPIATVAD